MSTILNGKTKKKRFIVLAGPIGAGKSEAMTHVVEKLEGKWIPIIEPLDDVLPMLTEAYKDEESAREWNLRLQLKFFNVRVKATRAARTTLANGIEPTFVSERSVFDDIIFMRTQERLGKLREGDFDLYKSFWDHWVELLELDDMVPDLVIYMRPDDDECWRRIKERDRECERTMTREYTDVVNEEHDKIYLNGNGAIDLPNGKQIPVLLYKSNADFRGTEGKDEATNLSAMIMTALKNIKK